MPVSSQPNPYRPGAAHMPPYLAGRARERADFRRLLRRPAVLENIVLTGLRGVGKTALLRVFRGDAAQAGWLWVENDISENVSVGEEKLLTRLVADLGVVAGDWIVDRREIKKIGFKAKPETREVRADFHFLSAVAADTPGLMADKLKAVLNLAWQLMQKHAPQKRGVVFAYDAAQNLDNRADKNQYSLSMLLDVFSSLQSRQTPFMLALTGLPPLQNKLTEARTFAERMFHIINLRNLERDDAFDAILKPLSKDKKRVRQYFEKNKKALYEMTAGYPYFIQYWCRELYDYVHASTGSDSDVMHRICRRLDNDFFAGRWSQLSDRQRDLLLAAASVQNDANEFSARELLAAGDSLSVKPFSDSQANQILSTLADKGIVFKSRRGKYTLAVPLLGDYIRRCHLNLESSV